VTPRATLPTSSSELTLRGRGQPQCLLCGSTGEHVYENLADRFYSAPGSWTVSRCNACGLFWLDPMPIEEDIGAAYASYYTHSASPPRGLRGVYSRLVDAHVRSKLGYPATAGAGTRILAALMALVHPGGEAELGRLALNLTRPEGQPLLLEIGCGSGELLSYLRDLGWRVEGVEVDPKAVETARSRGLEVRSGALDEQSYPTGYADVICLVHVIEHVHDPVALLRECRRVLKADGRLVLATPNSGSLGHRWFKSSWYSLDPPRHLVLFDPATIRRLLSRSGFDVERLVTTARGARSTWTLGLQIRRTARWNVSTGPPGLGSHLAAIPFQLFQRLLIATGKPVGEELLLTARPA
jgi:SAM-dependent methyltransferase